MEIRGNLELVSWKNDRAVLMGIASDIPLLPVEGISIGAEFTALDTSKRFLFDGESWRETEGEI